jgi:glutamine amidotransferase
MTNKKRVSIIDYDMGNLRSITKSFEYLGAEVSLIKTPNEVLNSDYLVLPGVGAFKEGMKNLENMGLIEPIKEYCKSGKPLLGICLGMQLLMNGSEEFGNSEGLGIIDGKVVKINPNNSDKVPHIGWDKIFIPEDKKDDLWENTLFSEIIEADEFYFVHSFIVVPEKKEFIFAITDYAGIKLCSAVKKGRTLGCQFHPEKSGRKGLKILEGFLSNG